MSNRDRVGTVVDVSSGVIEFIVWIFFIYQDLLGAAADVGDLVGDQCLGICPDIALRKRGHPVVHNVAELARPAAACCHGLRPVVHVVTGAAEDTFA